MHHCAFVGPENAPLDLCGHDGVRSELSAEAQALRADARRCRGLPSACEWLRSTLCGRLKFVLQRLLCSGCRHPDLAVERVLSARTCRSLCEAKFGQTRHRHTARPALRLDHRPGFISAVFTGAVSTSSLASPVYRSRPPADSHLVPTEPRGVTRRLLSTRAAYCPLP
jgi:hypothetical protein